MHVCKLRWAGVAGAAFEKVDGFLSQLFHQGSNLVPFCVTSDYPPHFLPTSDGCLSSWVITRSISLPSSSTDTASVTI